VRVGGGSGWNRYWVVVAEGGTGIGGGGGWGVEPV